MPVGCSFGGANWHGEDHDQNSTDRLCSCLIAGRSYVCPSSKWSAHRRISTGAVESQSLRPRLPSSLRLSSSLSSLRLPSSAPRLLPLLKGADHGGGKRREGTAAPDLDNLSGSVKSHLTVSPATCYFTLLFVLSITSSNFELR